MTEPLVSVITNCFNDAQYLRGNVQSVLGQRYRNFEHIVIDCGSSDESLAVLAEVAHPRLRVLSVPHCGLSAGRNRAIAAASGELVAILDADDRALPDRLSAPAESFAADARLVACGGAIDHADESTGRVRRYAFPRRDAGLQMLLDAAINPMSCPTVTFRRDAFLSAGRYDERFRHAEDYELMLRLRAHGGLATSRLPLARYAYRPGSHSSRARLEVVHYTILARLFAESPSRDDSTFATLDAALRRLGHDAPRTLRGRWSLRALLRGGMLQPRVARYLAAIVRCEARLMTAARRERWWRRVATPSSTVELLLGGDA